MQPSVGPFKTGDPLSHDMAILVLLKRVQWSETVRPVCLPPPAGVAALLPAPAPGKITAIRGLADPAGILKIYWSVEVLVTTAGWGSFLPNSRNQSDFIRKVDLQLDNSFNKSFVNMMKTRVLYSGNQIKV